MALEADERIIEAALRAGCCKKYRPKLKLQWPPTPATSIQEPPAPGLLPPSRQDGPQIGHGNEKSQVFHAFLCSSHVSLQDHTKRPRWKLRRADPIAPTQWRPALCYFH